GLAATTWTRFNWFEQWLILLYGLLTFALWHAPTYGWLLFISAWARRAAVLWAVLPLLAVGVLEKLAFNSTHVASLMKYRFMGHVPRAFTVRPDGRFDSLAQLTPGTFLSTPGLWIGLVVAGVPRRSGAAAPLSGANLIRIRRNEYERSSHDEIDCRSTAAFQGQNGRCLLFDHLCGREYRPGLRPQARRLFQRSQRPHDCVLHRCDAALL